MEALACRMYGLLLLLYLRFRARPYLNDKLIRRLSEITVWACGQTYHCVWAISIHAGMSPQTSKTSEGEQRSTMGTAGYYDVNIALFVP